MARGRCLVRRHRSVTAHVSAASAFSAGGHVSTPVEPGASATLEETVAHLVRESKRAQGRLNNLEHNVRELPEAWQRDVAAAGEAIEELVERRLTETQERYLRARQLGLVCLIGGLVLASLSNAF